MSVYLGITWINDDWDGNEMVSLLAACFLCAILLLKCPFLISFLEFFIQLQDFCLYLFYSFHMFDKVLLLFINFTPELVDLPREFSCISLRCFMAAILKSLSRRSQSPWLWLGFWRSVVVSVLPCYLGCSCCWMACSSAGSFEVVNTSLFMYLLMWPIQQVDN